jgi:hypothetical protein
MTIMALQWTVKTLNYRAMQSMVVLIVIFVCIATVVAVAEDHGAKILESIDGTLNGHQGGPPWIVYDAPRISLSFYPKTILWSKGDRL